MKRWAVYRRGEVEVHVVPVIGDDIAPGHEVTRSCRCHPKPERDAPLDEPVWSHQQSDWPGAQKGVLQ